MENDKKTTSTRNRIFDDLEEWLDQKRAEIPSYDFEQDEDPDDAS